MACGMIVVRLNAQAIRNGPRTSANPPAQGYLEVLSHYLQTRPSLPYKSTGSVIRRLKPTIIEAEHPPTWSAGGLSGWPECMFRRPPPPTSSRRFELRDGNLGLMGKRLRLIPLLGDLWRIWNVFRDGGGCGLYGPAGSLLHRPAER